MSSIIASLHSTIEGLRANIPFVLIIIASVWLFNGVNWVTREWFTQFGIYPRDWRTLIGILFSPFLHGNFTHLLLNSVLFFVLASFVLLNGYSVFYVATSVIIVLGGMLVWLFGRQAMHIGASGLNMGYWGFLLVRAYNDPSIMTIAVAVVILYYFGGLFFDLFPREEKVSWEGHLFGFIAGFGLAFIYP